MREEKRQRMMVNKQKVNNESDIDDQYTYEEDRERDKEEEDDTPSRIIYCTRTHSQIEQIFDEIKERLPYIIRVSPFASRKHSCIYESLPEQFPGNALNISCRLLRKLGNLQQKTNRDSTLKVVKRVVNDSTDIENTAEEVTVIKTGCPFYYGYSTDQKSNKPEKSINYVASKLSWD